MRFCIFTVICNLIFSYDKNGHLMPFLVLKFSQLAQSYKQTYVLNFKIALNYKIDKGLWRKSLN